MARVGCLVFGIGFLWNAYVLAFFRDARGADSLTTLVMGCTLLVLAMRTGRTRS